MANDQKKPQDPATQSSNTEDNVQHAGNSHDASTYMNPDNSDRTEKGSMLGQDNQGTGQENKATQGKSMGQGASMENQKDSAGQSKIQQMQRGSSDQMDPMTSQNDSKK